ncbi:mucolipin-1-like isoform X3 [Silurus meridionalis]|uniref:mucolipin-1-like isoform X3 n=1 Tax=Silurus meridionalis TaxID=175797 RepID=UPI001EEAEBF9|nr:mucolipin-1-like isoform X3 [Silurus meridionalis]
MEGECVVVGNNSEIELRRKLKDFFMSPCEKYRTRGRKPFKLTLQLLKITIITVQYVTMRSVSVGNHAFKRVNGTDTPLTLCQRFYTHHQQLSPDNETFYIAPNVQTECVYIYSTKPFNVSEFTLDFNRLLSVNVHMNINAINLQTLRHDELPDCYSFSVRVVFENSAQSGRMRVYVHGGVGVSVCAHAKISGSNAVSHFLLMVLYDLLVVVVCVISLVLCTRSVQAGMRLINEYAAFARVHRGKLFSSAERMEFINGWNILIIISDTLTVTATSLKICILFKVLSNYTVCSTLLGTATLLVWIGVLRYLRFFQKYNILILTMRAALPSAMRFSLCAVLIYLSYCFCGWIVLGPHHENFRSFHTAAYCLLSMINGDEIYASFTKLRGRNTLVWFFSRFYIYSFVFIFTYMVLSLFIAIITDTYELIKKQQQDGEVFSDLQKFMAEYRAAPAPMKTEAPRCSHMNTDTYRCSQNLTNKYRHSQMFTHTYTQAQTLLHEHGHSLTFTHMNTQTQMSVNTYRRSHTHTC